MTTLIKKLLSLIVISTGLFIATQAHAQLVLNIDQNTEEVFFTGTDSGTPEGSAPTVVVSLRWEFGTSAGTATIINVTSGINFNSPPSTATLASDSGAVSLNIAYVLSGVPNPGVASLAGNSTRFSYAALPAANKLVLESLASAGVMPVTNGAGTSPLQVNLISQAPSAIPVMPPWLLGLLTLVITGIVSVRLSRIS